MNGDNVSLCLKHNCEGSQAESTNTQRNCSCSLAVLGRGALLPSFDPLRGSLLVVCALCGTSASARRRRRQSCVAHVYVCMCVCFEVLCRGAAHGGVRGEAWATPSFDVAVFQTNVQ